MNHACHMVKWYLTPNACVRCFARMYRHGTPYERGLVCYLLCEQTSKTLMFLCSIIIVLSSPVISLLSIVAIYASSTLGSQFRSL